MPTSLSTAMIRLATANSSAQSVEDIYRAALDGITSVTGVERASILLFDPDGVMRFKAWRGLSDAYRVAVEGHTPWTPGAPAPDPIVVVDVQQDASLAAYAAIFAAEDIRALAFIPIVSRDQVIGKFMLYQGEPDRFDRGELRDALAIGYQIGFAVERTRREQETEASHRRMLFALDAAQMGTWRWDVTANTVTWSDNLERIHGLPPGTFTGAFESYDREIHPDDRERVLASLRRALTEGAPHDVEYRIVAPDGSVRWVQGKGRVELDASGVPVVMSGVCMDISARKRTEATVTQALEAEATARRRLTDLTRGAHRLLTSIDRASVPGVVVELATAVIPADAYAVWRMDADGWRITASRGLSDAFTAVVLDQRPQIPFAAPIIAEDVQAEDILEARRRHYADEGIASLLSVPLPIREQSAGSIAFYYRRRHRPTDIELHVATALGQLAAAAIANSELYEEQQGLRRDAEEAEMRAAFLAEASALLSSLDYQTNLQRVAALSVPTLSDWCAVDLLADDGTIQRLAVTHTNPEEIQAAHEIHKRYPPSLDDATGVGFVIRTGQPQLYADITDAAVEASVRDEDHLRMVRALRLRSAMVIPLSAGRRTFGALTFVTTQGGRPLTARDLEVAMELARRAALAVENARLFQEAREANRLKDEFLATLSHELRTPLNVILGRIHRIPQVADDAVALQNATDTIERNAHALNRLVEDLLDVSRFTVGHVNLQRQPADWRQIVETVTASLEPTARAKTVTLNVDVCAEAPLLVGDPTRLQQIAWNLITNAIKFTPAGGRVDVQLAAVGGELVMTVRDSGVGIAPAFLPYVFDLFRQEEPTTNRQHGGLGLGLSIVKRLVELHGGQVTARSAGHGQGATFEVRLPCSRETAPDGDANTMREEQLTADLPATAPPVPL